MAITTLNNRSINRSDTATSGQKWTATSATASDFQAAGGITAASQWRVTTSFTGDADPIASNWEEADAPTGFGVLGSSMTESSGVFTFPSTGYWLILTQFRQSSNAADGWGYGNVLTTHNNSTYTTATTSAAYADVNGTSTAAGHYIFDVTDTTNYKCKIGYWQFTNSSNTCEGNTGYQRTGVTFIRLGDT